MPTRNGLSLYEVLLAMTILGCVVGPLMTAIHNGDTIARRARHQSSASMLAANEAERIKSMEYTKFALRDTLYQEQMGSATYFVRRSVVGEVTTLGLLESPETVELEIQAGLAESDSPIVVVRLLHGRCGP